MDFNEEKAKEIVSKHGLSANTAKVWKSRGRIPDKYLDENYSSTPMNNADKVILSRIREIVGYGLINVSVLCDVSGVSLSRLSDSIREKGRIDHDDLNKIVIEIKRLRVFIKNNLQNEPKKLRALLSNKELKFYKINGKDEWAKAMNYAISKENKLSDPDFVKLSDNYWSAYV